MSTPSDNHITFLARTDFRNQRRIFGISRKDRRAHAYVIGKTGTGKSTLLETLIRQDVVNGEGLALLDPHGDLAERVLAYVTDRRKENLIYFNVPDRTQLLGFNPLDRVPPENRALAASALLDVFKKIWADSWGPRLEHILRNVLLTLLDQTEPTLADIPRLLDDRVFRRAATSRVSNRHVLNFWLKEYESYPARFRAEAIAPLQNKVGAFLANPLLNRIVTTLKTSLDLRQVIDDGRILLVNLAKGKIGEDTAMLLGALLVSRMGLTALTRADRSEPERRDFYLYLDEFHTFTTLSLANMLSELRKYRLNLILAHQYLGQLDEQIRDAVLGNVGTVIAFRIGLMDAELLGKEFFPELGPTDLIHLPNYHVYVKLLANGAVARPFSGETLGPVD